MSSSELPDIKSHERRVTTEYIEVTPGHSKRRETPLFREEREALLAEGFTCFIGSECEGQLECHHFFVEWSKTNATDFNTVRQSSDFLVNPQNGYAFKSVDWERVSEDPTYFVDHRVNLMILCEKHHRKPVYGIHYVPFSLWILQKFNLGGFDFTRAVSGS